VRGAAVYLPMGAGAPQTIAFAIDGRIARADLRELAERVSALLERSGAAVVVCDLGGAAADAVTVDALARLQLAASRYGCRVCLRHASAELVDLIGFMGLEDVLPDGPLRVEPQR
jgi:ABC-type transporter Mla MlaB component